MFSCLKGTIERCDVGVARGTVSQDIRPGAGFKTVDFGKRKVGGATVEQHKHGKQLQHKQYGYPDVTPFYI